MMILWDCLTSLNLATNWYGFGKACKWLIPLPVYLKILTEMCSARVVKSMFAFLSIPESVCRFAHSSYNTCEHKRGVSEERDGNCHAFLPRATGQCCFLSSWLMSVMWVFPSGFYHLIGIAQRLSKSLRAYPSGFPIPFSSA